MWRRWWLAVSSFLLCAGMQLVHAADAAAPSAILIDAIAGQSLREQNADASVRSGSLNQLMVLLLSLEEAGMGALPLDASVTVNATAVSSAAPNPRPVHAAARKRTQEVPLPVQMQRLSLRADKVYVLSDLLKAMVLTASNEAAVAAAEAIAGSTPACVELMNARAQRLGMDATQYGSIVGEAPGADATTARDLARLAHALVQHPAVLEWASLSGLPFDQGAILLRNVNQLISSVAGVDGLQVSSTPAGGSVSYSIVATAQRGTLRLIAVVTGAPTSAERYSAAAELLEWGFAHYERIEIVRRDEPLNFPVHVRDGSVSEVTPVAGQTFSLLRPRDEEHDLQLRYQLPTVLTAPLKRHQQIGEIIVEEKGQLIGVVPVLSPLRVRSAGVLAAALP